MPNLISQANRLNDFEINNNKPITSGLLRRFGSSVNFLLDLVGANDGDTATSGDLSLILRPPEVITFSKTFTAADIGIDVPLFSYEGGGARPLKFYQTSSGFSLPEVSFPRKIQRFNQTVSTSADWFDAYTPLPNSTINPFLFVLYQLGTLAGSTGTWTVKVNGITFGTARRNTSSIVGVNPLITIDRDIIISPTGTNTLTVNTPAGTSSVTVAGTFTSVVL
jgi:hypothetical protein